MHFFQITSLSIIIDINYPWRYGWFSNAELASTVLQSPTASCSFLGEKNVNKDNINGNNIGSASISAPLANDRSVDLYEDQLTSVDENNDLPPSIDVPSEMNNYNCMGPNSNLAESADPAGNISWNRREAGDGTVTRQLEDLVIFLPLSDAYISSINRCRVSAHWCDCSFPTCAPLRALRPYIIY